MIKEVIYNLRRQPVVSAVTVIGTALSIFLIMVFVMMNQIKVAPFAPESNRDRFLHYDVVTYTNKTWDMGDGVICHTLSMDLVKELLYSFNDAEAVSAYTMAEVKSLKVEGNQPIASDVRETDADFFNVFDFTFVSGKPFSKEDFESGLPVAVIDTNVSRQLFGTENATGKSFSINGGDYRVCGVVRPVSTLANRAYANVWINTGSTDSPGIIFDGLGGGYTVTMLIPKGKSINEVKASFDSHFSNFQNVYKDMEWDIIPEGRPYSQEVAQLSDYSFMEPDLGQDRRKQYIIYAILLLVPAINLSGMTNSRLRERVSEIAVKRIFGATGKNVFAGIFMENFIVTLIGGVLGLLFSIIIALGFSDLFFSVRSGGFLSPVNLSPSMLLHWSTFGWALLFCFILNILSNGLPTLQAARTDLVSSLRGGATNK